MSFLYNLFHPIRLRNQNLRRKTKLKEIRRNWMSIFSSMYILPLGMHRPLLQGTISSFWQAGLEKAEIGFNEGKLN